MKKIRVTYTDTFAPAPMTFWVHRPSEDRRVFEPPLPKPVPGQGFARYHVEFDGFEFVFASLLELRTCIEVLGQRLLPTTRALSVGTGSGPNSHWLSRLPSSVKPWRYRQRAVRFLAEALDQFNDPTLKGPRQHA
jgi:hypothetical protein